MFSESVEAGVIDAAAKDTSLLNFDARIATVF
jgi:hypothetical protein